MSRRVLLTGAGGFIGAHTFEHLLRSTNWHVVASDSFRHEGKTDRLREVVESGPAEWDDRFSVYTHDLSAPVSPQGLRWLGKLDYIIAMASESSVDVSIEDPVGVVRNNTDVILHTLELARAAQASKVIVISTDEVYGPEIGGVPHPEWDPILPSNPYSASKAAQEAIAISYWRTYGVPLMITNCMNLVGERQAPSKYLPMLIKRIRDGEKVTVHGRANDIGTRHYLHARNLADALVYLLLYRTPAMFPAHIHGGDVEASDRPDRFNIVGPDRLSNLDLAWEVARIMGEPLYYELVDFHSARPGHDPHYGLNGDKMTGLGWLPPVPFGKSLERTVSWTLEHDHWLL